MRRGIVGVLQAVGATGCPRDGNHVVAIDHAIPTHGRLPQAACRRDAACGQPVQSVEAVQQHEEPSIRIFRSRIGGPPEHFRHLVVNDAELAGARLVDRKDIDVVTICEPDHWQVKIAIHATRAGKDLYCEKPLALTADEGKKICKVVEEAGRALHVGTQQWSEFDNMFLKAVV